MLLRQNLQHGNRTRTTYNPDNVHALRTLFHCWLEQTTAEPHSTRSRTDLWGGEPAALICTVTIMQVRGAHALISLFACNHARMFIARTWTRSSGSGYKDQLLIHHAEIART